MALSYGRRISVGETEYAHEKEGIKFAIEALPDRDPFHTWELLNLLDPTTGRLHEIDLIVIGYSSIYVVELKHYGGEMQGDSVDWIWTTPHGRRQYESNPYGLTRRKAQILKSRLDRTKAMRNAGVRTPWVQPLVFLSNPDIKLNLQPSGEVGVVTQRTFAEAITQGKFPGNGHQSESQRVDAKQRRALVKAFEELGIRPRKGKLHVGSYELGGITSETDSYQDRSAVHQDNAALRKRARIYLVPEQTSVERRQQLRRAADRESQLLYEVREHPGVLTFTDYISDAPLGPTVLFDAFDDGVPLDAYLRRNPDLSYSDRIEIIEQAGRAIDHCHKKEIVHGSISPASILVRKLPDKGIEIRLYNFQLGGSDAVEATSHWSALASESWDLYQAPELRADPSKRSPQSDLFSLGAVAYFCLTGRAPATNLIELMGILKERRCLDPRVVDDSVSEDVADIVGQATHEVLLSRYDDVGEWVDLLLEFATAPKDAPEVAEEVSPLDARKTDILVAPKNGDLMVHGVLGHGATSRVLEVERDSDGKHFALKVSISPEHDERLEAEAKVLEKLRHPRIVQVEESFRLCGRSCLLLSLAGSRTLHRELAKEGAVSLDYAARFGEDLLSALEHLEESDIIHRDIKPANVGVGAPQRKKLHLTLFDFSLGEVPRSEVAVGTAAYRDPHLPRRGEWDAAGDRWSAAITLHELLTAQRPAIQHSEDGGIEVLLAAERFDSSVRKHLTTFFDRAFAPEVDARFPDAHTMRKEWEQTFAQQSTAEAPQSEHEPLSDEAIAKIDRTTAIAALPLSNRAKNALDRAGVLTVDGLLDLADNRLSAIRGVGREVAKDILDFRRRWMQLTGALVTSGPAFFPGYKGESLLLVTSLTTTDAQVLCDAGLSTLGQLASAPKKHIAVLVKSHKLDQQAIRNVLIVENDKAGELSSPTTLEGWLDALLPKKSRRKHFKHMRALFGLEGPLQGKLGCGPRDLARALKVTAPAIYVALNKSKEAWLTQPAVPALLQLVQEMVDDAGGAIALRSVAAQLVQTLPHDVATDEQSLLVSASALVRVTLEVDKDKGGILRFVRFTEDQPWIFTSEDRVAVVRELGKAADVFAAREILAGPGEVERELSDIVSGTALEGLARDKLARLAAAASKSAACSSRLELYPRNMSARRALELSSSVLGSGLSPDDLRSRVHTRYPAAEELPDRPALDVLLEGNKLTFQPRSGKYERPSEASGASLHTSTDSASLTHVAPRINGAGVETSPQVVAASEFEDKIKSCLEYRTILVLGVGADKAAQATEALSKRFGLVPRSFDRLFVDSLKKTMADKKIDADVVYAADKDGPGGPAWVNLSKLATAVAKEIAKDLLPPKEPLLLTQPGLIDRYQLVDFLKTMVTASQDDDAAATILLVPGHEGGIAKIEGRTEIAGLLPGQCIKFSKSWLVEQQIKSV